MASYAEIKVNITLYRLLYIRFIDFHSVVSSCILDRLVFNHYIINTKWWCFFYHSWCEINVDLIRLCKKAYISICTNLKVIWRSNIDKLLYKVCYILCLSLLISIIIINKSLLISIIIINESLVWENSLVYAHLKNSWFKFYY